MDILLQQKGKRKMYEGELDDEDTERQYDPVVASAMEELQAKKRAKQGTSKRFHTILLKQELYEWDAILDEVIFIIRWIGWYKTEISV